MQTRIAICVPVRDEAARLPGLFAALQQQREIADLVPTVCLYLDGCSDGSDDVVRQWSGRTRAFAIRTQAGSGGVPNAGRARAAAMAIGVDCLDGEGVILTTDGDSAPAPDWIRANLDALAQAEVVAGRAIRDAGAPSPMQDRLESYYDGLFALRRRLDPVPWEAAEPHHAASGASLGFRLGAYRALGGFAPIPFGEDARIVDEASRAGFRVRRDAAVVVRTSARRQGRAPGGLAAGLAAWDRDGGDEVRVAHPHDACWQYRMQALARAAFGRDAVMRQALGTAIGLPADHVLGVERDSPNAEAFAMRVVPAAPSGMRQVPLDEAEAALARLTARPPTAPWEAAACDTAACETAA